MADTSRSTSGPSRYAVSMSQPASAPTPLAIDRVERARAKKDQVRLRLTGHWLRGGDAAELEALLVVQVHGQRHRFPAGRDEQAGAETDPTHPFSVTFTIPDWAVPEQPGQAVLWVGDVVVAVPPPGTSAPASETPAPPSTPAVPASTPVAEPPVAESSSTLLGPEPGRAGPLADLLFKETVSALHSELEQRAVELARLRGELAQARTDLQRGSGSRTGLEAAHVQLREELERLTGAVAQQRDEFEQQAAQLRDERDRAHRELERERADGDVRLTEARARFDDHLETARSEFDQQLAAVRAEAEQEMTRTRAETDAMLDAARSQVDSRAQAAETQAATLGQRLASLAAAEHRRAEEAAALREQLAVAHIARDAAFTEAEGLRGELERLGSELAVAREQSAGAGGDLSDAERLLSDARALTERLRSESSG
jgi:hypothetical protein